MTKNCIIAKDSELMGFALDRAFGNHLHGQHIQITHNISKFRKILNCIFTLTGRQEGRWRRGDARWSASQGADGEIGARGA